MLVAEFDLADQPCVAVHVRGARRGGNEEPQLIAGVGIATIGNIGRQLWKSHAVYQARSVNIEKGQRFSDILVDQAVAMGADILATACPYCLLNFKDSVVTADKADVLEVKDISEVVLAAMGEEK
jgi:hypothetical protein